MSAQRAGFQLPVRPEELRRAELLQALPDAALGDLAGHARRRRFRAGQVVFNEGDTGTSLHVVRRGHLKVVRPTHDDTLVLDRMEPGQAFGELAVLNSAPRTASMIAIEDCETLEIRKVVRGDWRHHQRGRPARGGHPRTSAAGCCSPTPRAGCWCATQIASSATARSSCVGAAMGSSCGPWGRRRMHLGLP